MAIDSDDLTEKTYQAIIGEAECFDHSLTLQFGLLSYSCKNETDFIKKAEERIYKMLKYREEDLDEIFFRDSPLINDFKKVLKKVLKNISTIKNE